MKRGKTTVIYRRLQWNVLSMTAVLLLCGGCVSQGLLETLPWVTDDTGAPETTSEVATEASTEERETETEKSTPEVSGGQTIDVTLPYMTEESSALDSSGEETGEELPSEAPTWGAGAVIGVDEFILYDHSVVYEDADFNYRITFQMPQLYVSDSTLFDHINSEVMTPYTHCRFNEIYVLEDIEIDFHYQLMTDTPYLLSFFFTGDIRHLDTNDGQFRSEDFTNYAFTMERLTGHIYSIEDAYGMEEVCRTVSEGKYRVVKGSAEVFQTFTNEQLAALYRDFNAVSRDVNHEQDFYVQDGKVCILIWVGNQYGNYVILELDGNAKIS